MNDLHGFDLSDLSHIKSRTNSVGYGSEKAVSEVFPLKGRIYFFFILFLAICSLGLRAQDAASFRVGGLVHDGTGAVIPGAEVMLRQADAGTALTKRQTGRGVSRLLSPLRAITRSK